MSWAIKHLKQEVTYWAPSGDKDDQGFNLLESPILLKAHTEVSNTIVRNSVGTEVVVSNLFYLNAAVHEGGFILEGDFTSYTNKPNNALEIKAYHEIPDLRNLSKLHKAYT